MRYEKKAPVLTGAQFRQVLSVVRGKQLATRNEALLYVSFALGLRAKEMSQLKVRDVLADGANLKEEVLLTRSTTKGRKQRLVYLTNPSVARAVKAYLEERRRSEGKLHPDAPLFRSRRGGAFSPNTMQMLFKRMYVAAGLCSASSHSGRRTFATSLIEHGTDIKAVSSLMGHASVAMTAQYVQDNPVRLKRICEGVGLGV